MLIADHVVDGPVENVILRQAISCSFCVTSDSTIAKKLLASKAANILSPPAENLINRTGHIRILQALSGVALVACLPMVLLGEWESPCAVIRVIHDGALAKLIGLVRLEALATSSIICALFA